MYVTMMVACSAPHMHTCQQHVPPMLEGWRLVGLSAMTIRPRMTWDIARPVVPRLRDLWTEEQGGKTVRLRNDGFWKYEWKEPKAE